MGYHGKIICKVTLGKRPKCVLKAMSNANMQMMLIFAHAMNPIFLELSSKKKCTESLVFVLFLELALNIALRARHNEPQLYGSLSFTVLNRPKRDKNHFFKRKYFPFLFLM